MKLLNSDDKHESMCLTAVTTEATDARIFAQTFISELKTRSAVSIVNLLRFIEKEHETQQFSPHYFPAACTELGCG